MAHTLTIADLVTLRSLADTAKASYEATVAGSLADQSVTARVTYDVAVETAKSKNDAAESAYALALSQYVQTH